VDPNRETIDKILPIVRACDRTRFLARLRTWIQLKFPSWFPQFISHPFYAALVGSFLAIRWLHRSSTQIVSVINELKAAALGTGIAVLAIHLCRWIVRRFYRERIA
jgi:hypothetical protein